MPMVAAELLRPDLLHEISILVVSEPLPVGAHPVESFGQAVGEACEQLGARVHAFARGTHVDEAAMDAAVASATTNDDLAADGTVTPAGGPAVPAGPERGGLDMLVVDGVGLFASGGLRACLESAWDATRAVVNLAFLPAGHGGRIVYLAPSPAADRSEIGRHADAARAGLENLGRTLSTEWARHGITLVTITAGEATPAGEVAALTAYLASPAGAYFSGCLLDLRGTER
jgi:NAD(P)-dependent dehydrogenase (short-subunit alcohol dehydrogenase family)